MLMKNRRTVVLYDLFVQVSRPGDPTKQAHIDELLGDIASDAVRRGINLKETVGQVEGAGEREFSIRKYSCDSDYHTFLLTSTDPSAVDQSYVKRNTGEIRQSKRDDDEDPGFSAHLIVSRHLEQGKIGKQTVARYRCALEEVESLGITRISKLLMQHVSKKSVPATQGDESFSLPIRLLFRPHASTKITDAIESGANILEVYCVERLESKQPIDARLQYAETITQRRRVRKSNSAREVLDDFKDWAGNWFRNSSRKGSRTAFVKFNISGHDKTIRFSEIDDASDVERVFAKRYDIEIPNGDLAQCAEDIVGDLTSKMREILSGDPNAHYIDAGADPAQLPED